MANEYSSFSYLKPADYLPSFDQTANLDAWDDAIEQEKRNANNRTISAKRAESAMNQAVKLAPTLAKQMKAAHEKQDELYMNEGHELYNASLAAGVDISLSNQKKWEKENQVLSEEQGFFDTQAAKLQENNPELAEQLRNLTGRRAVGLDKARVLQSLQTLDEDFASTRDSVIIERDGADPITWDNAQGSIEKKMIMARWRVEHGLKVDDIGKYGREFLAKHYYPGVQKWERRVLATEAKKAEAAAERQHLDESIAIFTASAQDPSGLSLGETVLDFVEDNKGRYNGKDGARSKAVDLLLGLVENGSITAQQFHSVYNHKFSHNGTGQESDVSVWREFDLEKNPLLANRLQEAERKSLLANDNERQLASLRLKAEIQEQIQKRDSPITEAEVKNVEAKWKQQYPQWNPPDFLKTLANNTLEDRLDDEIILDLQHKLDQGLPLGNDYAKIKDPAKYAKWQKISQSELGQGLGPTAAADHKYIEALVKEELQMTEGVMNTQTPLYHTMLGKAKSRYAYWYRMAPQQIAEEGMTLPQTKSTWAMQKLQDELKVRPTLFKTRDTVDPESQLTVDLGTAQRALSGGDFTVITSGIIPGTESAYKIVESQWVKNPNSVDSLPPIYRVLANTIAKTRPGYTAWHLARDQYKAVTGKELPEPKQISALERKPTLTQHLMTFKASPRTVRQAAIEDKNDGNYNGEGMLTNGVTVPNEDSTPTTDEVPQ